MCQNPFPPSLISRSSSPSIVPQVSGRGNLFGLHPETERLSALCRSRAGDAHLTAAACPYVAAFRPDPPTGRHDHASNSASNCGSAITHATAGRESAIIRTGFAASYRTRDRASSRSLLRACLAQLGRRTLALSTSKQRPHRTTRNEADSIKERGVCQARSVPIDGAIRTISPLLPSRFPGQSAAPAYNISVNGQC